MHDPYSKGYAAARRCSQTWQMGPPRAAAPRRRCPPFGRRQAATPGRPIHPSPIGSACILRGHEVGVTLFKAAPRLHSLPAARRGAASFGLSSANSRRERGRGGTAWTNEMLGGAGARAWQGPFTLGARVRDREPEPLATGAVTDGPAASLLSSRTRLESWRLEQTLCLWRFAAWVRWWRTCRPAALWRAAEPSRAEPSIM